jgi:hypothetical protein
MAREVVVRITCDQCGKKFFAEPDKHYSLQVGDRVYEFCDECRGKLLDALDGKGEKVEPPAMSPIVIPIVPSVPSLPAPWHPNTNPIWIGDPPTPWPPYQPYVGDPPYDPRPTIICGTTTVHSQTTCCIR